MATPGTSKYAYLDLSRFAEDTMLKIREYLGKRDTVICAPLKLVLQPSNSPFFIKFSLCYITWWSCISIAPVDLHNACVGLFVSDVSSEGLLSGLFLLLGVTMDSANCWAISLNWCLQYSQRLWPVFMRNEDCSWTLWCSMFRFMLL